MYCSGWLKNQPVNFYNSYKLQSFRQQPSSCCSFCIMWNLQSIRPGMAWWSRLWAKRMWRFRAASFSQTKVFLQCLPWLGSVEIKGTIVLRCWMENDLHYEAAFLFGQKKAGNKLVVYKLKSFKPIIPQKDLWSIISFKELSNFNRNLPYFHLNHNSCLTQGCMKQVYVIAGGFAIGKTIFQWLSSKVTIVSIQARYDVPETRSLTYL